MAWLPPLLTSCLLTSVVLHFTGIAASAYSTDGVTAPTRIRPLLVKSTENRAVFSNLPLPQLPCTGVLARTSAARTAVYGPIGGIGAADDWNSDTVTPLPAGVIAMLEPDPMICRDPWPVSSWWIAAATAGLGGVASTDSQSLPITFGAAALS